MFQKIRELSKDLAIYGIGDVAISVLNFLLLPIYVRYLSPDDYGVLGLLGSVEVAAKIFFRWGLDGSFMRFYYDCGTPAERRRLASTLFFFLLIVNGALLIAALGTSGAFAARLFGGQEHVRALQLTLLNTFVIAFTFFPFHLLRIEKRSVEFGLLTFSRSVGTLILRIVLIIGLGFGVLGVVIADIVVTALLMVVLIRRFAPLIRPMFSWPDLRTSLRFGLPRVPHAAAQQVIAVGDKFVLALYAPLSQVGIYSMGVSFGLTQKLFLSAFEYAWAPFYYANAKEPDAKNILSSVTTYGFAVLALLTAGLSAVGEDLLLAVVGPDYRSAAGVVTWTAVGVLFQGIYLLTSIGLNLTKRTEYYPVATTIAAAVNIALNLLLIPRVGFIGAAWATAAAYAVQAAAAFRFSQRFYPMAYETSRLVRIAVAAAAAVVAARLLPEMAPLAGLLVRGSVVVALFGAGLWTSGFFKAEELARLVTLRSRRSEPAVLHSSLTTEMAGEIVASGTLDPQVDASGPQLDRAAEPGVNVEPR